MSRGIFVVAAALVIACGVGSLMLGTSVAQRVRRVNSPNAKLEKAIRQARREMPEFVRQLVAPLPQQKFAIRGRFKTRDGPEYLWLRDPMYFGTWFVGTLDQEPVAVRKHRKGEPVRVAEADVVDWLIRDSSGQVRGGYTEQALRP